MNSKYRMVIWGFAGALATLLIVQVYAIRELLAAFALFAVACAAIALVVFMLYMLDWFTGTIALGFQRAGHTCATWTRNALIAGDVFGRRLSLVHALSHAVPAIHRIRHHSARGGSV